MPDITYTDEDVGALAPPAPAAAAPPIVYTQDDIKGLEQLGRDLEPNGPAFSEKVASQAMADTPDPSSDAVGAGLLRDGMQLFTADNSYHNQTFASLHTAAVEVGYHHMFGFLDRLNSKYHELDVEDGTKSYIKFIDDNGLRDIDERLARPLKNAFTFHAMVRNTPLHGAYRATAAGSAGRKMTLQFLQKVADTGTPLAPEQLQAQKVIQSMTNEEWEEAYRESVYQEAPAAKNEQTRQLAESKRGGYLQGFQSAVRDVSLDQFDMKLRESATRFPEYIGALQSVMGTEWRKDFLAQYGTEAMLMKSGMLRMRQVDGIGLPRASEISLDAAGMLTPIDLLPPALVNEVFEDAHRKQGMRDPGEAFDDSGRLRFPEAVPAAVSQALRDPSYAAQEALTPYEKNLIHPVTGAFANLGIALFQDMPAAVRQVSVNVDNAISSLPFVQDMAKGAVQRLTGDRDAAVATRRLSDAMTYFFKTAQEQNSVVQTVVNYLQIPNPLALVAPALAPQLPPFSAGAEPFAAITRQEETRSFGAFGVLNGEERQVALQVFNRANDALAANFESVDKMGEVGLGWLSGDNDAGPIEGPANLLAYGTGKLLQQAIIKPIADVIDDPHMAAVYSVENLAIGGAAQGVWHARHALMGKIYRANKLDLYLRRMTDILPSETRKIQQLAREEIRAASRAGRSVDAAFDDVVAVAKTTLDELELGSLSGKTAATFVDKVKNVWPSIGENLQPISDLINSRFTPGGGILEHLVRKVAPNFRVKRVDKALLRSVAPELNDRTVQAVTDILSKANANGWTHSQRRQRMRLFREITGRNPADGAEKLAVMNGEARALAEITPRLNMRRAKLDEMRTSLEQQMQGPHAPATAHAYQTTLAEMDRLNHIEQVWRGAVPQRDMTFLADLLRTVERVKTRKLPLHTRAMNGVLNKFFGVNSVQGEFLYDTFNNVVSTALDGANTYAMRSSKNAWQGAVINRQYKVALEKARNAAETHETLEAGLGALRQGNELPSLEADLAQATSDAVAARARVRSLEAEYDRTFSRNERGETVFRLDPTKKWQIPRDSELFRWVDDNTLYTSLRADPTLGAGPLAEDLFTEVPTGIARRTERAADIDNGIRVLQQDVLRHQKTLAEPWKADTGLKILDIRRTGAKSAEARTAAQADYQIEPVTGAQWGERLDAAAKAGQLSTMEREIHGFIRNTLKSGEVDNWGRSINSIDILETPYDWSIQMVAQDRAKAMKIARHLQKRYGMEPPILSNNRSMAGHQKWREFADYQFDLGNSAPGLAAAEQAYTTRLAGLKNGSIISPGMRAARQAVTDASDKLKSMYRRQRDLADPSAYVRQLTPTGRKFIDDVYRSPGVDEVTEAAARDATGFAENVQSLVSNRIGQIGLLMTHMSPREQLSVSKTNTKTIQHNQAAFSVKLQRQNDAYWALPRSAKELLGRSQRAGVLPRDFAKKHPKFAKAYNDVRQPGGQTLDDLFDYDADFQASLIERLRETGRISDEMYEDLLRKGYDPQLHFGYETAKFVDDPIIRKVREARAGVGSRGGPKSGAEIDGLKFARHLKKYRLRVAEADGKIVQYMFDDESALREFAVETYGPDALPEGAINGVARKTTKLREELTYAEPLGPEAQEMLDTVMGAANTPDKRLIRWADLNKNIALQDYLNTMKLMTGMVLNEKQMAGAELKNIKAIADYVQLPNSRQHFGNMAGHFVHKRVLADLNAMSHSYRQIEAWLNGIKEGFELFDSSIPQEIIRKTAGSFSKVFQGINQLARYQLIHLSVGTRVANHTAALYSDHLLGTRLFSLKNLDIRDAAWAHITKKDFSATGGVPDAVYNEFVQHGFLDQGFEARSWTPVQADAMKRMLGLPKHPGFWDHVAKTLKLNKDQPAEQALRVVLKRRKSIVDSKLEAIRRGESVENISRFEQELVAYDAMVEKLSEGYAKGLGNEVVGFYGTAGSQDMFRSSSQLGADFIRESYNNIDTFYKYSFYRVLRDKMGVPSEQAAEQIRRFTQQFRDLPPGLHKFQDNPLGGFVVGFAAEMARISKNGLQHRPGRMAAWMGIVPALNFSMASAAGIDPSRQVKHLQGMGWRDRASVAMHYASSLIIPNNKGEISTVLDLNNVLFPQMSMVFGNNTMKHIYDSTIDEDPKARPLYYDLLGMGATALGTVVLNNPAVDTLATAYTQRNPRTGRPIFTDPEQEGFWSKLGTIGRTLATQYLSPHTPMVGRSWQNLADAYEAGIDPITRKPRGLTPADALTRSLFNVGVKGDLARFFEKQVLGQAGRDVAEVMAGPGRQLSEAGPTAKARPGVSTDIDILRSVIFSAADVNGTGDKVLRVQDSARKMAADLYYRVAEEGNQPEVWEKIGKLLTIPTTSRQGPLAHREVTRPSADDVLAALNEFGRKGWDDQYSVLDVEEKVVAMIQADVGGVGGGYMKEMATLFVTTDYGNERKSGAARALVKLQRAKRRLERWLETSRARREFYMQPGSDGVMTVMDSLDQAIQEAQDAQEYELDPMIKRQEKDIELGRPQVRP